MGKDRKEYYELSHKLRGIIIEKAINLETLIDDFIAMYFCHSQDKFEEFKKHLFWNPQTGFGRKFEIFKFIVLNKSSQLIEVHPTIIEDIDKIVIYRNMMAHRVLDVSRNAVNKGNANDSMTVKFLKSNTEEEITKEITDKLIEDLNKYTIVLYAWKLQPY